MEHYEEVNDGKSESEQLEFWCGVEDYQVAIYVSISTILQVLEDSKRMSNIHDSRAATKAGMKCGT